MNFLNKEHLYIKDLKNKISNLAQKFKKDIKKIKNFS